MIQDGAFLHVYKANKNILNNDSHEDFVLRTPWPVISLTASYLYFVLVFGPSFMKTKRPMLLKGTILAYNATQIVFSLWWFYEALKVFSPLGWRESFNLASGCSTPNSSIESKINLMGYWYLISKLVELLDTIFFVLRRKQSQVTFLHVYHHSNMVISTWFFIKYNQAAQSMIIGLCNTFVHVVMYGYYLLSGLGPKVRKYLWWKKYITALQITQFLIILAYLVSLCLYGCRVGTGFIAFTTANTSSFLALFINFYFQEYRRRNWALPNSTEIRKMGLQSEKRSQDIHATSNNFKDCKVD